MRLLFSSAVALALALPAAAQPPERTTSTIVYGNDPCPSGEEGEIVVCGRRDESERYRIPKELREEGRAPLERSWADRNRLLDDMARDTMPGSCSVVGSYGQSGCHQKMIRQWYDERRMRRR